MAGHEAHIHHQHEHHYHLHGSGDGQLKQAFVTGIALNLSFVVLEVIAGFWSNSLALLSDAGHNLGDVAGLGLALFALRLTRVKGDNVFTYGYNKTTVLAALVNSVVLLVAIGGIGYEAIQRLINPQPAEGALMAAVALVGIVINGVSAMFFMRDKEHDLNARGAFLHLAGDAAVSLGVVMAGAIIYYTHLYWIDSVMSLVIMLVILYNTWGLLIESVRLSLDAAPRNINVKEVEQVIVKVPGIIGVHHIHVWALSTRVNALTAHLVVDEKLSAEEEQKLKETVKNELLHNSIQHATLETERGKGCENEECD